jgi:hypothetical protein
VLKALRRRGTALALLPPAPAGRLSELFLLAAVSIIPLALLLRLVLPERYYYDGNTIRLITTHQFYPAQDLSYLRVGLLYRWLGLVDRPVYAGLLGAALVIAVLYPALVRGRGTPTLSAYLLVGLFVVTASAYLTQYSKDVWVIPVVLVVLLARPGLGGELAILAATGAYAAFFRSYWWPILAIYVALRILTAGALRWRRVATTVVAVIVGATVVAPWVLGGDLQGLRASINATRILSPDAATAITTPFLGPGLIGDIPENLLLFGLLVMPVPLMFEGLPLYFVYAIYIFWVWVLFARATGRGPGRVFDGRPAACADVHVVRAALFVIAFVVTLSFFEPDYGSYLRHLTPLLPLIILVTVGRPGAPLLIPPSGDGSSGGTARGDPPKPAIPDGPAPRGGQAGGPRGRHTPTTGETQWV